MTTSCLRHLAVIAASLAAALILLTGYADAQTIAAREKRIALVVGIGGYENAPKLANPTNDARKVSEALRRLNFEVDEHIDPSYRTLARALREFGIRAQQADAALVYYAGHGVQFDRENYLLPVDARLERERDLVYETIPLDLILGEVSQAKKVGIVLLDACRNNPFVERVSRAFSVAGRASPSGLGLARVDKVPRNTIVVMSTKADQIAEDGSGENSPFTEAVLAHLQIPGLELGLFFRSVRDTVLKATSNRQEPYVFSSLGAEPFYFFPRPPNRPPELQPIVAIEVSDAAGPTPLGILRPTDPDQDPLSVRVTGLPRSGEVRTGDRVLALNDVLPLDRFMAATYKPDGKMTGHVGTFDFLVEDGRGGSVLGVLPITVLSSNHPPVVAAERIARIYPGALGITPPTDPDGDPLTVTIVGLPGQGVVRNGSAAVKSGDRMRPQDLAMLTFSAEVGASGDVGALRYVVDDGRGGKAEGTVKIEVARVDEAPVLMSDAAVWDRLRVAGDSADIEAFLRLFPDSRFADAARARRTELAAPAAVAENRRPPAQSGSAMPAPPTSGVIADATPRLRPPQGQAAAPAAAKPPDPPTVTPSPPPPESKVAVVAPAKPPPTTRGAPEAPTFQDCPTCPVMVRLPGGSFMMGQASGDASAEPQRRVGVHAFAMGQFPVTVAEWKECVQQSGCAGMPRMAVVEDRMPVYNISWEDAQQYVSWLARTTGKKYRLPSEAEWEYAARGNTTTRYWWGGEIGVALANCSDCGGKQDQRAPLPVGSFKANPFGLYDTLGGVAQWVADCWFPNYQGAPTDGSAREQKNCSKRVLRGGSFRSDRASITTTARNNYDASVRYVAHGFRVVRDLD